MEDRNATVITRTVDDLEREMEALVAEGYRLDMIMPADEPREALLSRSGENLRLVRSPAFRRPLVNAEASLGSERPPEGGTPYAPQWSTGRAGMQYRDLIPDRFSGRLIASHIRIANAGPVPDYVHYHKIGFQMIYCKAGWVRVVYEDQGPPFLLEAGDCVLQPPEIRHRVLEASAGAEVIELGSPAEHETWIDHELELPTQIINADRSFSGQTFVRHIGREALWEQAGEGLECRNLGLLAATAGSVGAKVMRTAGGARFNLPADGPTFFFVLSGSLEVDGRNVLRPDECILIAANDPMTVNVADATHFLKVSMPSL